VSERTIAKRAGTGFIVKLAASSLALMHASAWGQAGADVPDTPGTGPFPAIKEEVASLPKHVVYRPADLSKLGNTKLGVLAWGNGGCSDDGASSRLHLLEIASHGYLVIANGTIKSGPGTQPSPPPAPRADGQLPPPATSAEQLIESIDWALAENARQGSALFGRIDPNAIAISGFSCGGLQALKVGNDKRVRTLIIHNSGIFSPEHAARLPSMDIGKETLKKLHTPVLYIQGGPTDIAYENGMDDFRRIEHVPAAIANLDVGHGGTFHEPNGGRAAQVAVAWLQWQLRGDENAKQWFVGADCRLCKDADWKFESKNLK
jgi:hypothetical protein